MFAYTQDPDKTKDNGLITGYECTPEYAHEEFALTMEMYEHNTGRKQKDNSRLVYHIRQAFKPDEVEPAVANQIGYELALEYTGGKHAFVVATHTDRQHIHNHIIFCAFNLEADGKFRDAFFNYRHVAEISDKLCKEYDLSVIEQKQGWRDPYNEWEQKQGVVEEMKPMSHRKRLEEIIGFCLNKNPKDFDTLLRYLEDYDCYAKRRSKNISVTTPFSKKPIRLSSLSAEFDEYGIKAKIEEQRNQPQTQSYNYPQSQNANTHSDTQNHTPISASAFAHDNFAEAVTHEDEYSDSNNGYDYDDDYDYEDEHNHKPEISTEEKAQSEFEALTMYHSNLKLIIDIQNSLKAKESIGYKKWCEKFNLEQMSQTLIFIEKHDLTFDELQNMATRTPQTLQNIKDEITTIEKEQEEISTMQRHIGNYGKYNDIYKRYQNTQFHEQPQFWHDNEKELTAHAEAREHFSFYVYTARKNGNAEKIPTIKELQQQYATLTAKKNSLWEKYHDTRNSDSGITNAWANVKTILNVPDEIKIETPTKKKVPNRSAR